MAGSRCLLLVIFIVSLATGIGSVSAAPVLDPASGNYYELVSAPSITWVEARDAAAAAVLDGTTEGYGHLAAITSPEENAFVFARYPGNMLSNKWIGGFQGPGYSATVNDGWQWVTGEPWEWTNWNTGEPNNYHYGVGYEDVTAYWSDTGKWNDAPALWQYSNGGYLIEWDCIPVTIDIRPGDSATRINPKIRGTVPVAVLGSADLDVTTIDPATIRLGDASLAPRGPARDTRLAYSFEDVNGDGFTDLVAHFSVPDLGLSGTDTGLLLTALAADGPICSSDTATFVPV